MSEASNIENFNTLVGLLFEQLYEAFPIPTGIDTDDIAATLGVKGYTIIPHGDVNILTAWGELMDQVDFQDFYNSAIAWLSSEGLIREVQQREFVLTAAALTALNAQPDALKEPLGRRLQGITSAAGTEVGKAAIAEVVGQVIGAAFRGFASGGA